MTIYYVETTSPIQESTAGLTLLDLVDLGVESGVAQRYRMRQPGEYEFLVPEKASVSRFLIAVLPDGTGTLTVQDNNGSKVIEINSQSMVEYFEDENGHGHMFWYSPEE